MKPTKKFISLALALVMCLSLLPMTAMAAEVTYATTFSTADENSYVVKEDGTLWGFGRKYENVPIQIAGIDNVSMVADWSGGYALIVLKNDGTLWNYKDTSNPEKIDENVKSIPQNVLTDLYYIKNDNSLIRHSGHPDQPGHANGKVLDGVAAVSDGGGGGGISLALKTDGSVWAWGKLTLSGQDVFSSLEPTKVADDGIAVAAFPHDCFIIKSDNTLWSMGLNRYGNLGDGSALDSMRGEFVKILDDVVFVTGISDGYYRAAIKSDGSVWAWGSLGESKLLGEDWERAPVLTPQKMGDGMIALSVDNKHGLGLKSDGTLWSWGDAGPGGVTGIGEDDGFHDLAPVTSGVKLPNSTTITSAQSTQPTQPTTPTAPAQSGKTVNPTASKVFVNGAEKSFEAYNIDGSNYFKLRDIAMVLNGTSKPFEVGYDNNTKAITMTSGQPYTPTGGEMAAGDGQAKPATPTASKIYLDGTELSFTVYNIGGSNFFKLVDLMSALNIGVTYNEVTRNISIDTNVDHTGVVTVSTPDAPVSTPTQTPPTQQPTAIK